MTNTDQDLEHALNFDPLAAAEQIMGRDDAVGLGLLLAQGHARTKTRLLTERDDTVFSNTVERYLRILHARGFKTVLCVPFTGRAYHDSPAHAELLYVLAHRDGLLLKFDTYNSTHVNSAKVWYNWQPHAGTENTYRFTSSGSWHNYDSNTGTGIWAGDHDAREALCYNMDRLRANGDFLARWKQRPFLWLLHYRDTDDQDYDYNAINEARIALLPEWVQTMITPEE